MIIYPLVGSGRPCKSLTCQTMHISEQLQLMLSMSVPSLASVAAAVQL